MDSGPLHPRRIQAAIERVSDVDERGWVSLPAGVGETCLAALKVIHTAQTATGLTPQVADAGAHLLGVIDYVKSGLRRK